MWKHICVTVKKITVGTPLDKKQERTEIIKNSLIRGCGGIVELLLLAYV